MILEKNVIKIDPVKIQEDEKKLCELEKRIKLTLIKWEPEKSKGEMVDALQEQVKEVNRIVTKLTSLVGDTRKKVCEGRVKFVQTDKEQAKKIHGEK